MGQATAIQIVWSSQRPEEALREKGDTLRNLVLSGMFVSAFYCVKLDKMRSDNSAIRLESSARKANRYTLLLTTKQKEVKHE